MFGNEEKFLQLGLKRLLALQRLDKDIEIDQQKDGYISLLINGKPTEFFTPTGFLNVVTQYNNPTYPKKWFDCMGIPSTLDTVL